MAHMPLIHIADIEAAINYWREKSPSVDGIGLAPEVNALAAIYGQLVHSKQLEVDEHVIAGAAMVAWLAWYDSTPDTPCIAICSTSQGDSHCKGCGRSFDEVQHWTALTPPQKRAVWRRITLDGSSWRFNKYAERAITPAAVNN